MPSPASNASNDRSEPTVLLVEDETLVAMLLEDMLSELGCASVQSASHVKGALDLLQNQTFTFAILDIDLGGESSIPVADALRERGIPFFFSSGYGADAAGRRYADINTLPKPFRLADLKEAIADLALTDVPKGLKA